MTKARIVCPVGDIQIDQTFGAEATLGRSPNSTVVLGSDYLSSHHARIVWDPDGGHYLLEDLGSSNGTRLDGEPVLEPQPLGHLHVITLAERFDFVFQDLDRCAARHGAAPRGPARPGEAARSGAVEDVRAGGAEGGVAGEPGKSSMGTMHTSIEVLDLPLPRLLRESATTPTSEKTLLQRLDLPLPTFLKGSASTGSGGDGEGRGGGGRSAEPGSPFAAATSETGAGHGPSAASTGPAGEITPETVKPRAGLRPTRPLPGSKEGARSADPGGARAPASPAPVPPKAKGARWTLEVPGKAGPERFRLAEAEHVVGRSVEAQVVIRSPEVSRRHSLLTVRDGRLFVRDLGSRNGTYVDDVRIVAERELTPGRRLRFGALEVRVIVGGFSDAGRELPEKKSPE